jgi:predicted DNA-binding transcriptional regulator AlpA
MADEEKIQVQTVAETLSQLKFSRATLSRLMKTENFPPARKLSESDGPNCRIGFLTHEVNAWLLSRPVK